MVMIFWCVTDNEDEDDDDHSWSSFHAYRPRLHGLARIFSIALHSKIHDPTGTHFNSIFYVNALHFPSADFAENQLGIGQPEYASQVFSQSQSKSRPA